MKLNAALRLTASKEVILDDLSYHNLKQTQTALKSKKMTLNKGQWERIKRGSYKTMIGGQELRATFYASTEQGSAGGRIRDPKKTKFRVYVLFQGTANMNIDFGSVLGEQDVGAKREALKKKAQDFAHAVLGLTLDDHDFS